MGNAAMVYEREEYRLPGTAGRQAAAAAGSTAADVVGSANSKSLTAALIYQIKQTCARSQGQGGVLHQQKASAARQFTAKGRGPLQRRRSRQRCPPEGAAACSNMEITH